MLRQERVSYDARGKRLNSMNSYGTRDTLTSTYDGLGHLRSTQLRYRSVSVQNPQDTTRYSSSETFKHDGLANVYSSRSFSTTTSLHAVHRDSLGGSSRYHQRTGRLASTVASERRDTLYYDAAGNVLFFTQSGRPHVAPSSDRASYYGVDGKLAAQDYRSVSITLADNSPYWAAFEEYRYDALGRRVWVRARRWCANVDAPTECRVSWVRRTVWDGDQELYEIQMPGGDLDPTSVIENDTAHLPMQTYWSGEVYIDPNPFFGRVAYAYGGGIDRPLSVTRMNYSDRPSGQTEVYHWPAFTVVPLWSSTGTSDNGFFADGAGARCLPGTTHCVNLSWPLGWLAYALARFVPTFWHGTLTEDKQDAAGTYYRRNRYYDPMSGRFTQPDPIGLAGGLNAYGFADGDPVSYSDPSGLRVCAKTFQLRLAIQRAVNAQIRWDGENCATNAWYWGGEEWRRIQREFEDMLKDPRDFTVAPGTPETRNPLGCGYAGDACSWFDDKTLTAYIFVDQRPRYRACGGPLFGSRRYDLEGVILHELLGHGRAVREDWSLRAHTPMLLQVENDYHRIRGQKQRCPGNY
jgi:RHS repeat-associated protein